MKLTSKLTFPGSLATLFLGLALVLINVGSAYAQFRASLQGTVLDPSSATVPGASVTLQNNETNFSQTVTTNDSGTYSIPGLAPGRYTLTVEKDGFSKQVLNGLQITSEQAQSQNVQLELAAQTSQTVTVTAASSPSINTENANVSGTLTGQEIQNLPTFGRDPFQAVTLAPGVFGDNARGASGSSASNLPGNAGPGGTSGSSSVFQTENQVQSSAAGGRTENNSFQVDGVGVNSLAWGGAAVITPNQESVKEVTVEANPYDAENGRNSGAEVLVVSKNGTNEFHGSAMMQAQRPGLNAYQRWNGPGTPSPVQRDTDRFNQFAGSLGGPIIKNRLFFFFSYETIRNQTSTAATGWYETPQYDSLVSSLNNNSIASRITGFPGEGAATNFIIPRTCAQAGFSAPGQCQAVFNSSGQYQGLDLGSPLRSNLKTPDPTYLNNGAPGIGSGLDGVPDVFFVQTSNPSINNPQQYNGRADYQATNRDRITFSVYYVPNNSTFYNGAVRKANLWNSNRTNEAAALVWNHTISSTWLNEARFNVTRWYFNEISSNPQEPFGLPLAAVDQLAGVNINANPFGAPGPGIFAQTTYNFRDTVSTIIGNHSLKLGVDINKEQDNDNLAGGARPSYSFRNLWDFANDAPYQENGNFNPLTGQPSSATKYIRSATYAGFAQDNWRATPTLTLNLGLRWEYFQPVHEKYGNISNAILGNGPDPLLGLSIKLGGNLYHSDYKNFAPQIGFAWNPDPVNQRFVLRGGFGIGYNRMEEAITLNGRANPPLISSFNLTGNNILYQTPASTRQFAGWPINPAAVQTFDPTTNLPTSGAPVILNGFPENLVTPRTYRYSLMEETNLGASWVAKLGYQGSLSRHQTIQNNLNFLYAPLNPRVSNLYWYENDGNANFNAFLAELSHNFAKQFQFDAQYRWANSIDDGSNSYSIGEYPYGRQYRRGPSDFDVRHNVKLYGVWSPTLFKGQGFAGKVLGGWQISSIFNWHTGFPWTPQYSNFSCNIVYTSSGYCSLRPSGYLGGMGTDFGNSTFQSSPNGNFSKGALSYFTLPAYTGTGVPTQPGVGRNSLRGPGYLDTDATIQKSFGLPKLPIFGENARLTIRGDLFNIFNRLNLSPLTANGGDQQISFNGATSNPLFGQSQSALAGRIVTLQARFDF